MSRTRRAAGLLLAAALAWSPPAGAQEAPSWTLEEGSRVGFVALQGGAPVEGRFETFEADIRFDPAALDQSRVKIVIDVASVNSESSDRDTQIRSASLFDVATWPQAFFEAERFEAVGEGRYEAHGRLTLRDVTREVVLPFELDIAPHPDRTDALRAHARGELMVSRLDYGVGQGLWTDTSVVADEIVIRIDILATRPAG